MRSKFILLGTFALGLLGCASESTNLIHVQEAQAFSDEKTVFYSNDSLPETQVPSLLNAKVKLPQKVKIAVIKLQSKQDQDAYHSYRTEKDLTQEAQNNSETYLLELIEYLSQSLRNHEVKTVLVPDSLVPAQANIKWMRNLGVTMQADLILVVDSRNDRYRDKQIIKNGIAMSISSADTYLIDARTGIILETSSYTKDAFTEKTSQDFDVYQTLDRARSASEKKIYKKLATDVVNTLETIR
ncbi:MAG: hypothetical protein ACXWQQ_12550 [Pseudobdellovibrio sp.]